MSAKRIIALLCSVFLLVTLVSSCGPNVRGEIKAQTGLELGGETEVTYKNSHGGFLGDGATAVTVKFRDGALKEQIEKDDRWHALPMSQNVSVALYGGTATTGAEWSSVVRDLSEFEMPEIENGYWFFRDRHPESSDNYDDAELFSRVSFNFVISVYDADLNVLYYFKIDT